MAACKRRFRGLIDEAFPSNTSETVLHPRNTAAAQPATTSAFSIAARSRGLSTDHALELAAARQRIKQLETELAVARKVNEVFLKEGIHPKGSSR